MMRTLMIDLTGGESREVWVAGAPMCPVGETACDGLLQILPYIVWCPVHRIVVDSAADLTSAV